MSGGRVELPNLKQVVIDWLASDIANHGLSVRAQDEYASSQWKNFSSVDTVDDTKDPLLIVNYNPAPSLPANLTPAGGSIVSTVDPNLSGTFTDTGDTGYLEYEVIEEPWGTDGTSGNSPTVSTGSTATWTISPALLNGTTYKWRARSRDAAGGSSNWTSWRTFTVDLPDPAPGCDPDTFPDENPDPAHCNSDEAAKAPGVDDTAIAPAGDVQLGADRLTLPTSPLNKILVVDANVAQSVPSANDEPCPNRREDSENVPGGCEEENRERRLAKRLRVLGAKPQSGTLDGMQFAPDVILLQETRCQDVRADGIAAYLNDTISIRMPDGSTEPAKYRVPLCSRDVSVTHDENPQAVPKRVRIVNDTSIIYLSNTMGKLDDGGTVITRYRRDQSCPLDNSVDDVDWDGDDKIDCGESAARTWKRHFVISLEEKNLPGEIPQVVSSKIAVASVHLLLKQHLKDSDTHEDKKRAWTQKIANELERRYPLVDTWALGGDFNIARCRFGSDTPRREPINPVECGQREWWTSLVGRAYSDTIFTANSLSQDELTEQYRDGCEARIDGVCDEYFRGGRIDFMFAKNRFALGIPAASHDLTCGEAATTQPSCLYLQNTDRYSDHRLVWAFVPGSNSP